MFLSRRGHVRMSCVTLHQWWNTVGLTARQLEPLTYLTSVVNVQTGIADYVRTLTPDPWHLEMTLATRVKGQRSNEAQKWSNLVEPRQTRIQWSRQMCLSFQTEVWWQTTFLPTVHSVCVGGLCINADVCAEEKHGPGPFLRLQIWSLMCSFSQCEINQSTWWCIKTTMGSRSFGFSSQKCCTATLQSNDL